MSAAAIHLATTPADLDSVSEAMRLWCWLVEHHIVGAARAVKQVIVAHQIGTSTRLIQRSMGILIARGMPVCSSCAEPMGIFVPETIAELDAYIAQLQSRLIGDATRVSGLKQIRREKIAAMAVEPGGQGRLFA